MSSSHPDEVKFLKSLPADSPLLNAWVLETARLAPGIIRSNRVVVKKEGYEFGGYVLPVGTKVMLDSLSPSSDKNDFANPDDFKPSRSLDSLPDDAKKYGVLNWGLVCTRAQGRPSPLPK